MAVDRRSVQQPLLSICIPTFNRRDTLCALLRVILEFDDVEVCVHIDGSADGTIGEVECLARDYSRLVVTSDVNRGIAFARKRAILSAGGRYAMLFDDDDTLDVDGFRRLLSRLRAGHDPGLCGFIFQMRQPSGELVGDLFPRARSNFLQLRWDDNVRGDKKEVVDTALLKSVVYPDYPRVRFVAAGVMWATLGLKYDVETFNIVVGVKNYLSEGLSNNIRAMIFQNPRPMVDLYRTVVTGFWMGRWNSWIGFMRALGRLAFYWVYDLFFFRIRMVLFRRSRHAC